MKKGYIIRKGERVPFIQTEGGFAKAEAATDLWVEFADGYVEVRPIKTDAKVDCAILVKETGPFTLPIIPRGVRVNGKPVDLLEMAMGLA